MIHHVRKKCGQVVTCWLASRQTRAASIYHRTFGRLHVGWWMIEAGKSGNLWHVSCCPIAEATLTRIAPISESNHTHLASISAANIIRITSFWCYTWAVQKVSDLLPAKIQLFILTSETLIPFKVVPLVMHTLLPAVLPLLETFLESFLWNLV